MDGSWLDRVAHEWVPPICRLDDSNSARDRSSLVIPALLALAAAARAVPSVAADFALAAARVEAAGGAGCVEASGGVRHALAQKPYGLHERRDRRDAAQPDGPR
jgi:hypothetical protein